MKRFGQVRQEEEADIDITPMLDVVFIMLIFFIVTASFVKEVGLNVSKPEDNPNDSEPSENRPIVIEVSNTNELRIEGRLIDSRSIKPTVVRMIAESPKSSIIVKAHKEAKTKKIIEAVDGIKAATGPNSKKVPTVTIDK